jgi:signal transduction histidine kinase
MKLLTVVFNIVLVVFTCLVLITDGLSKEVGYILLTLLLLFVPIFNLIIIFSSRANNDWLDFHLKRKAAEGRIKTDDTSIRRPVLKIIAIICNIVLLGFSVWAFASQYPHPKESGFILFAVIVFLTPVLSLVTLAFNKR